MADPVFESVLAIVSRVAGQGRTPDQPSRDSSLTADFWLDSVELLEVVIGCEHTFQIAFDGDGDLDVRRFETVGSLTDAVREKLAQVDR